MELDLGLEGQDATEQTLYSLQDWLKQEKIKGLRIETKSSPPKTGQMGADFIPILTAFLTSAAVVELVKSIHVWIQATRPKIKIKIQIPVDKTIEVDASNLPDTQALVDQVMAMLDES